MNDDRSNPYATPDWSTQTWPGPWLARRAVLTPNAEAVHCAERVVSYGALQAEVAELADGLRALPLRRGDVVAALLDNGLGYVRLLHALHAVGAVLLPLNARLTAEELAYQLRDSAAAVLVHEAGALAERAKLAASRSLTPVALLDESGVVLRSGAIDVTRAEIDALALLYTSGTSGTPKGALLGAQAFLASAKGSAALLGSRRDDRWLICMPLFHVGGLSILIRACLAGSCAVIAERFDPHAVSDALDGKRITMISLVANMLQRLLDARGDAPAPETLRCVLLGGGPAPEALLERAQKQGFRIAPTYGLTEAASQVATRPPEEHRPPAHGRLRALPGNTLRIIDEAGVPCKQDTIGEICVSGPTLMHGYLRRPEASAAALRDGWLHTGDLGRLDADGHLHVLDRRDDLIVSGGENVYPAEIEAALALHERVAEAGVVGVPDPAFGERPLAFWVRAPGADTLPVDLASFARERLARYKLPVAYREVSELPRNASGKLLRRTLRTLANR